MIAEPKRVSVEGAAKLARAGLFTRDELVGVDEHGAAIYAYDTTIIVRPRGVRPDGVTPYRWRGLR